MNLKFFQKNTFIRKLVATFGIILIFLIGTYIPVPGVDLSFYLQTPKSLSVLMSAVGSNLSTISLFSLGISPSMTTMILVRLLTVGKFQSRLSSKIQDFRKNVLMLFIATIQALAISITIQYQGGSSLQMIFFTGFILVAGAFVVDWLSNLNAAYGIGGVSLIVIVGMIRGQFSNLSLLVELFQEGYQIATLLLVLWTLLAIYLMVIFERSEYRIPVMRTSIHNRLVDDAYMPIKVNASGGMAFMYVYTLLVFPQYIIILLQYLFPNNPTIVTYNKYFSLSTIEGILVYMLLILVLSISFTFVNIDPTKISESMRESGDFISGYRPGKETQSYLSKICYFFGAFSGVFMAILGGLPLLLSLGDSDMRTISSITGIFMMLTGMSFMILDELQVVRIRKRYTSIFEIEEN